MKKLDWDLDDEPDLLDLFEGIQHWLGGPLHWGAPYNGRPGQTAPPPVGDTGANTWNIQLLRQTAARQC